MRATVRAAFVPFTEPLEGAVPWFYLDVKGLVTIGIGNLVDPVQYALALPMVRADGSPASREEIGSEWAIIKSTTRLARDGYRAAKQYTKLHLTDEGIADVVGRKLDEMWGYLATRFPGIEDWPGDAQLATLSMSWACGPGFRFPALESALRAKDFVLAANQCAINTTGNPGIVPRNAANRALYTNAARVVAWGIDPDPVYYPRELKVPPDAPTEPELPELPVLEDDEPPLDTTAEILERLRELGYDPGPVDGDDGPRTQAAVTAFQRAHGLVPDGKVGPLTKHALRAA